MLYLYFVEFFRFEDIEFGVYIDVLIVNLWVD